jgi:tetratricopeptide (TPR) repeat protein
MARQGDFSEAEREFRSAIKIDPESTEAYASLGMLEAKTGGGAEAVETFRKVVALQPHSADAHLNLGIALVDQYDRVAAFDEFTTAARINPNSPGPHYNLGHFYFETGNYDEARKELGAAAQYLLGRYLERTGKTTDAIAHWKLALQADPNQSEALYNLARTLNKVHDPKAQQYQDRFDTLQREKETTDRVGQLGNFAIQTANAQNWPQALQQMNEAIALCGQCGESAHLHRNLGLMYCHTGNLKDGERSCGLLWNSIRMTLRQRRRLMCFRISTLRITKTRQRAITDPFEKRANVLHGTSLLVGKRLAGKFI